MPRAALDRLAREFAAEISHLLNTTVCTGIRISAITVDPELVLAACGLTRNDLQPKPFRIQGGGWLRIGYQLCMDEERTYLTVSSSTYEVYADSDMELALCRFDYERDKAGYPEAHIQVYGTSPGLAQWPGFPARELERIHLPCGDRRYRPSLEDVIEFLIIEGLASGKDRWQDAVDGGRRKWRQLQLRAAVRRDPETARQALAQVDAR